MMSKRKKNEGGFTLIELIMVIVILGIISAVAIPRFLSLPDSAKLSAARAVGAAVSVSITIAHADYLINGTPSDYAIDEVLTATQFSGGITYQPTDVDDPAAGEIASNVAGTEIVLDYKKSTFHWTWNDRVGEEAGYIVETAGNFPTP